MEAIRDATTLLESFPAAGPALDRIARSLRVRRTPYVLIYRVDRTAVTLLRIRHTREDWRQP
jgi:toxin ParE1/3/4